MWFSLEKMDTRGFLVDFASCSILCIAFFCEHTNRENKEIEI